MKRKLLSLLVLLVAVATGAMAQLMPEGIMDKCPSVPSKENIADYLAKQSEYWSFLNSQDSQNAAVDNYFKTLKEARDNTARILEGMPAASDNQAKARPKQLENHGKAKHSAGAKMKEFIAKLTPEQQEYLNTHGEEDNIEYIRNIGKWKEFETMMMDAGAPKTDTGLTKEELEWTRKDLTAENDALVKRALQVEEKRMALLSKYREALEKMNEQAGELCAKIESGDEDNAYGSGQSNPNALRSRLKDLLTSFYEKWAADYIIIHNEKMEVHKLFVEFCKKKDKKDEVMNRMNGVGPLPPIAQGAYSEALMHLDLAQDILLGEMYEYPEEE
jgi:hypothetical protein